MSLGEELDWMMSLEKGFRRTRLGRGDHVVHDDACEHGDDEWWW